MNKELEKIRKNNATIMGDYPEKKEKLTAQYFAAKDDLERAIAAKKSANDLNEFDAAVENIKRAEARLDFIISAIGKLDAQPRMNEEDYYNAVATCERLMSDLVSKSRSETLDLMIKLKQIQDEYKAGAEEINETLEALDKAANVLQSKYLIGSTRSDSWKEHAIRFSPDKAARLFTECDPEYRIEKPHIQRDSIFAAAWEAVRKAFPHRAF